MFTYDPLVNEFGYTGGFASLANANYCSRTNPGDAAGGVVWFGRTGANWQ